MKTLVTRSLALLLTLALLFTVTPFTALAEAAENEDGMDEIMDILETYAEETEVSAEPGEALTDSTEETVPAEDASEEDQPDKGDEYPIPQYKHRIPVSDNPIKVTFEVVGERTGDGRIKVTGKTNLYDGAKLMVQLDEKATDHVITKNGSFCCILGAERSCTEGETHHVSVILSIPSTQDTEFLKWAGMEYENLSGDVMSFSFFSPSAKYEADLLI